MYPDYEKLETLDSPYMSNNEFQSMLLSIRPNCYVEANSSEQRGTVSKVIFSKDHISVCVQVKMKDGVRDYISVDRISLFEPYDFCDSSGM